MKTSVRFHVERRVARGPATVGLREPASTSDDVWVRETLAGAKTITGARHDRRTIRRESPKYFKQADFRIVKITTTTEVVT